MFLVLDYAYQVKILKILISFKIGAHLKTADQVHNRLSQTSNKRRWVLRGR